MRIDILTLFPEMFAPLNASIVKRARDKGIVELNLINIRDFATDKHQTADDRIYGGGAGMVMKPEPIFAACRSVMTADKPRIIITSPQGRPFDQQLAQELAGEEQIIIICGHYEGIDERVVEYLTTDMISLGDFVLCGGELAAMAISEAVTRLQPGALGDDASSEEESFADGLLEYPQYTRPPEFEGHQVPQVLQNGNHQQIRLWRRQQSLQRTWCNRPDLLVKATLTKEDKLYLERLQQLHSKPYRIFVSLLHYPVYNKKHQTINTSLTNLDLHDIARAAQTYNVEKYFIVQPVEQQRQLMSTLLDHWDAGFGAVYNPDRHAALAHVRILPYLEDAIAEIEQLCGQKPRLIATSALAKEDDQLTGYRQMRQIIEQQGGAYLLLLGTGWGLTEELRTAADYRLRPVYGVGAYNHLSVRSAASIMLDRLFGER